MQMVILMPGSRHMMVIGPFPQAFSYCSAVFHCSHPSKLQDNILPLSKEEFGTLSQLIHSVDMDMDSTVGGTAFWAVTL